MWKGKIFRLWCCILVSMFFSNVILSRKKLFLIREIWWIVEDLDEEEEERKSKLSLKWGMGLEVWIVLVVNLDVDV